MAKVSAERFLELLKKCELVETDQLKAELGNIAKDNGGKLPRDPDRLAERLIAAELLTEWQANHLLNGKHKGFRLGKYKLLTHLGTGGMSSVYLAQHTVMGHRVAIKVLPQSKVEDSSYLERFYQEAQAAARLNHPNIVRAHDIDSQGKTHYIVMDYVAGTDLQETVKHEGPLDYETAADFIAQAADGLQCAHDNKLIHRDIKPANLLVNQEKVVKILDMGLAKFQDQVKPSLTVAHEENVLGTADYLAPEQAINSHSVDHRVDIYSLGCTLYYLLTGHPPFNEGNLTQRLMKHQTQMPPSIYEDRSDAPVELVNICLRMMVKAPEGRYQEAKEIAADLRAFLGKPGGYPVRKVHGDGPPDQLPDGKPKELRTRKGPPPPPKTRSSNDTVFGSATETVKGASRRRDSTPIELPFIDTGSGSGARSTNAKEVRKTVKGGSSKIGPLFPSDSTARKSSGASGARRNAATATRPQVGDSSESIFDPDVFGDPTELSDKRSIVDDRASKRRKPDNPVWIWAVMAAGVIAVLVMLFLVMNR
ncbi:MAG: serine/threonine protein kinase [Planctomycetales bacterium]|nr:serine/threonine protein kinase [Planctomycetales bacterium]